MTYRHIRRIVIQLDCGHHVTLRHIPPVRSYMTCLRCNTARTVTAIHAYTVRCDDCTYTRRYGTMIQALDVARGHSTTRNHSTTVIDHHGKNHY